MISHDSPSTLSDKALLAEVSRLAANERTATAQLIAALAEVEARRLFLGEGYPSLFAYCTRVLHLSEHAAYGRIEATRAARRFPIILDMLEEGSLTLTSVSLLRKHLTEENHRTVLDAARHKSTREVERQVAALQPKPDVAASVRKLSQPKVTEREPRAALDTGDVQPPIMNGLEEPRHAPAAMAAPGAIVLPPAPAIVKPLAPERYKVQFTIGRETHDKLRRAQDLLRHVTPHGDPGAIFDRALTLLIAHLEKKKLGAAARPHNGQRPTACSRHIPASVRRAVWKRDGGRCAFVGTQGRCPEQAFLEFHHVEPYAAGGPATVENIQLRCRAHNAYEADLWFGNVVRETCARYGTGANAGGLCNLPDLADTLRARTRCAPSRTTGRAAGEWAARTRAREPLCKLGSDATGRAETTRR